MADIKFYRPTLKALRLLLAGIAFVLLFYHGLTTGSNKYFAWVGICFFGLAIPVALFQLFDRRPQIIINETGIYDRTMNTGFIDWELIKEAYIKNVYKQVFICLIVDQKFKPYQNRGKIQQKMINYEKNQGFQELNLLVSNVKNLNPEKLKSFILAMHGADTNERSRLIENTIFK